MTAAIGLTAVAVVGSEPISTGAAALDLARAEARHRRVMIVDLIGDAPPLRAVVATDDPHGVSDAFAFGVSFGVIARHTTVHPNVSIIPSGTEPIPFATVLPSARWTQLIDQVRARGELIVFAILSSTPAMGSLTDRVDCVIAAPSRLHEVLEAVLAAATTPGDEKIETVAPPAERPSTGATPGSRRHAAATIRLLEPVADRYRDGHCGDRARRLRVGCDAPPGDGRRRPPHEPRGGTQPEPGRHRDIECPARRGQYGRRRRRVRSERRRCGCRRRLGAGNLADRFRQWSDLRGASRDIPDVRRGAAGTAQAQTRTSGGHDHSDRTCQRVGRHQAGSDTGVRAHGGCRAHDGAARHRRGALAVPIGIRTEHRGARAVRAAARGWTAD